MLTLGGVKFGSLFCATGALGFYGEGYPFHRYWRHLGMDWDGYGFSGKTMTLKPRKGNMPLLTDGVTPKERFPRCIVVDFFRNGGEMFNAVGLSNFGLEFYLKTGKFYDMRWPFFISLSLDAKDDDESGQMAEMLDACRVLRPYLPFSAPVALQINRGCPNTGHDVCSFHSSVTCQLVEIAKAKLGIPVLVNCNALMPTKVLTEVARVADGLWIGNTIPWKAPGTEKHINWSQYGSVSPIRRRGFSMDGGLSSHWCLPLTVEKIQELRDSGVACPIVGGNGVRTWDDIIDLRDADADAVFVGSLAVVRPRRMQAIRDGASRIFS